MANGLWCGCCNDSVSRLAVKNARITVYRSSDKVLLGLYADKEGTKPLGNPFLTREDGLVKFYCEAGRIDINAVKDNSEHTFENEIVLDDWVAPPDCACGTFTGGFVEFVVDYLGLASTGFTINETNHPLNSTALVYYHRGTGPQYPFTATTPSILLAQVGERYWHLVDAPDGDFLVTTGESDLMAHAAWVFKNLAPVACQPQSVATFAGAPNDLLLTATTECAKELSIFSIFLDDVEGSVGPVYSGYENGIVGGSESPALSLKYATGVSSQGFSVASGADTIAAMVASLRTGDMVQGTSTFSVTPAGPITEFYEFAYGFSTTYNYGSISAGGNLNGAEIVEVYLYPGEGEGVLQVGITGTAHLGRRMTISIPGYEYNLESQLGEPWNDGGYDGNATLFYFVLTNPDTLSYCSDNVFSLRVAPLVPWMYDVTVAMNDDGIVLGEYGYAGYGAVKNFIYNSIDDAVMVGSAIAPSANIPPSGTVVANIRGAAYVNDGDAYFVLQVNGNVPRFAIESVWPSGLYLPLSTADGNYFYDGSYDLTRWWWLVNDAGVFNWDGLSGLVRGMDIVVAS